MKDNFSTQSADYAKFRPVYPQELIDYLLSLTEAHEICWDCGTGNGQLAVQLAETFQQVYATDISEKQLSNATQRGNIAYSLQPAEETNFPDQHFDLITVAQAAHWFDHSRFNREVKRTLKPDGVIALFGYGLVKIEGEVGEIITRFYWEVTNPYWDPERDHIEEEYRTIPFPFEQVKNVPSFAIRNQMTLDQLTGYISTWSAVQHYIRKNGHSPIEKLNEDLSKVWHSGMLEVVFPIFTKIGRMPA
ncbi:MAG: class I SAM-dependent methyltransferase [Ekhidna sp.]|uniref:class I SAM-dependent methyltransferase n=1 Tax=Ekhidna sp. TaxID=2608089 RepID=UPI0032F0549F